MDSPWRAHIWSSPDVMGGVPVLRGTRIPVSVVLDNLAAGMSLTELLASYPSLTHAHITAALSYAAELAKDPLLQLT